MGHHVKIGEKQIAKIVELHEKHNMTVKVIAERFGVQSPAITRILRAQEKKKAE